MLRIHCAAIKIGDVIHVLSLPAGHVDILSKLEWPKNCSEGFLTSDGQYVDRNEAGAIALAAGQVTGYNRVFGLISTQLR